MTIEKMIALRSVPIFTSLGPDALERLACSSDERAFAPGEAMCLDGELSDEVFVILSGEARVVRGPIADGELIRVETMSGVIGELSVLDAAPRSASVFAGAGGASTLRLTGSTFRRLVHDGPGYVRRPYLARRVRAGTGASGGRREPSLPGASASPACDESHSNRCHSGATCRDRHCQIVGQSDAEVRISFSADPGSWSAHGVDTWDTANWGEIFVSILNSDEYRAITGLEPPASPVDAATYTRYGFPWFDLYDESRAQIPPAERLLGIESLSSLEGIGREQSVDIDPHQITPIRVPAPPASDSDTLKPQ